MPVLWAQFFKMKLLTGILVFAVIAVPWYAVMFAFDGVDDEGKLFWWRFLVHDHLNRLGSGVHTTTPGGTFTYFIEQGGFAIFPWVALVPGAMATVARLRLRSKDKADHVGILAAIWLAFSFFLMGSSATKFHHYVFPMLPPLAILLALFIDRLWTEGISRHGISLMFGLPLFVLVGRDLAGNPKNFTDLFVYNYDRPYPVELVQRPIGFFSNRPLCTGDLFAALLLGVGGYLVFDAFFGKGRSVLARATAMFAVLVGLVAFVAVATRGQASPTLFFGLALVLVTLYLLTQGLRPNCDDKAAILGLSGLAGLAAIALVVRGAAIEFAQRLPGTAAADPLLPTIIETVNIKAALGFAFTATGALCVVSALMRARVMLFSSFWALACVFALWFNWSHWVDLSHHWTQRDQFWRYYQQRKPGEPIAAFLMNWRGETFYSKNTVKQIRDNDILTQYANQPGREWALVEHNRLNILKSAVGPDKTVTLVDRDLNNKFVLVTID